MNISELIVLNTTKIGEKSLVVHCMSSLWGRRSFITTIGKLGTSFYQPLSIIEAKVIENAKSDLWRISSVSLIEPLYSIRSNFSKGAIAIFISELIYRAVLEGGIELYNWLKQRVLTLERLENDYSNFHLRFLLELISAMGFGASTTDLMPFVGDNLTNVRILVEEDLAAALTLPLSGTIRSQIAESFLNYLSYHLDIKLNIKSLEVYRNLF